MLIRRPLPLAVPLLASLALLVDACRFGFEHFDDPASAGASSAGSPGLGGATTGGDAGGQGAQGGDASGAPAISGGTTGDSGGASPTAGSGNTGGDGGVAGGPPGSGGASGGGSSAGGGGAGVGGATGGLGGAAGSGGAGGTAGGAGAGGSTAGTGAVAGATGAGGSTAGTGAVAGATGAGGSTAGTGAVAGATGAGGSTAGAAGASGAGGSMGGAAGGPGQGDFHVTTAFDENDAGATVASPGGTGLSLREAVGLANNTAGTQSITFEPNLTIAVGSGLIVSDPVDLWGNGTHIDCSGIAGSVNCLSLSVTTGTTSLNGIALASSRNAAIRITAGGGYAIRDCELTGNNNGLEIANAVSGVVVENCRIANNSGDGITGGGGGITVRDCQFVDNANRGIYLGTNANDTWIVGNLFVRGDRGLLFGNALTGAVIRHNTFVSAARDGLVFGSSIAAELTNNVFAFAGEYGIVATDTSVTYRDYNAYFSNTSGNCSTCTLDAHAITADPSFASVAADNYTLLGGSPLIDAAIDRGEDRNGAAAGLFNGSAPDMGYWESP